MFVWVKMVIFALHVWVEWYMVWNWITSLCLKTWILQIISSASS